MTTKSEKETILRFSEDPEEEMTVYTHSKGLAKHMQRLKAKLYRTTKHDGREVAWEFKCDASWFRRPRKPSAARAEATRQAHQDGTGLAQNRGAAPFSEDNSK